MRAAVLRSAPGDLRIENVAVDKAVDYVVNAVRTN